MASLMLVNPRKRRKSKTTKAKRRTPSIGKRLGAVARRVSRRKYRRNPIGGASTKNLTEQIKNAAVGAAGALAVDVAMTKLPLPPSLQTGVMRSAAQGAVSIAIGMAVAKVLKKKRLGVQLAEGGLTVALHGVLKGVVSKAVPGLALAGNDLLGYEMAGADLLGYEMAGYDDFDTVGWLSPAPVSAGYDGELYN